MVLDYMIKSYILILDINQYRSKSYARIRPFIKNLNLKGLIIFE